MATIPCILLSKRDTEHPDHPVSPDSQPPSRVPDASPPAPQAKNSRNSTPNHTDAVRKLLNDAARHLGLRP